MAASLRISRICNFCFLSALKRYSRIAVNKNCVTNIHYLSRNTFPLLPLSGYSIISPNAHTSYIHLLEGQHQSLPIRAYCSKSSADKAREKQELIKQRKEAKREARMLKLKLKEETQSKDVSKNLEYNIPTPLGVKKDTSCALPASYSPAYVEAAWYSWWEEQGFFKPKLSSSDVAPFVVILPPPNVTGSLHLGHALGTAIQDAIVRWHRMCGDRDVLWVPGCDHAGIATQVVVEKQLHKEQGVTRHDIGRQAFVEEVWKWKQQKGDRIYEQLRSLGASLDWSRATFTLDPKMSRAVSEAFLRLHDKGLIHRRTRLVHWCCSLRSALSDIEVDDREIDGRTPIKVPGYDRAVDFGLMYQFDYMVEGTGERVPIATTRPETMLGDTGIAVHPDDTCFQHLHGKYVQHPLCDRKLPIVADTMVDRKLGTGAVKLTPAHDANDEAAGIRHGLPAIDILDDRGCMINVPQQFIGEKRFDARDAVLAALDALGLYGGSSPHSMVIPVCSRTGDIIEPRRKPQWFLTCKDMADKARQAVTSGRVELIPDHFRTSWEEWLVHTGDWCISRQLWWGHRIPAYRVIQQTQTEGEDVWVCGHDEEDAGHKAAHELGIPASQITLRQDEDVLDTWFSSALFPFAAMGWPDTTSDLTRFYPTSLLETGSDILFFWVARMVMLGEKLTGEMPFDQVLFHSILRDAHGRKMSKSLGNIIDPMDVIHGVTLEDLHNQVKSSNLSKSEIDLAVKGQGRDFPLGIPSCGADALRFTLLSYNYKAHFTNVDVSHIAGTRRFCNKIWQAFRFCQLHLDDYVPAQTYLPTGGESPTDKWILSRLSYLVHTCHDSFTSYNLNHATQALHAFWWGEFCDVYLEYSKAVLQTGSETQKVAVRNTLYHCLDTALRSLSPFMPYLTEELFQRLQKRDENDVETVCLAAYPNPQSFIYRNENIEYHMDIVQRLITTLLGSRKDFGLSKVEAEVFVWTNDEDVKTAVSDHHLTLKTLSRSADIKIVEDRVLPPGCVKCKDDHEAIVFVKLEGVIDVEAEVQNQLQQFTKLQNQLESSKSKLIKPNLPPHVVIETEDKIHSLEIRMERLSQTLESLKGMKNMTGAAIQEL